MTEMEMVAAELKGMRAEVAELRVELVGVRVKLDKALLDGRAGLYAACCRDYKILGVTILCGGGMALLAFGGLLAVLNVISLGDLKEFSGIAKSAMPLMNGEGGK